jgi:hypothetical protein
MSTTLPGQSVIRLGSDSITSFSWLKNMCIDENPEIHLPDNYRVKNILQAKDLHINERGGNKAVIPVRPNEGEF